MAGVHALDFDSPDETRTPDKTRVEVVRLGETTAARMTFEPGWKWSECVKPVAGTDSCQVRHVGVAQSGTIHISHEDGTEVDIRPGDAYVIEPGHDAWVVGDESFVGFEFEARSRSLKPRDESMMTRQGRSASTVSSVLPNRELPVRRGGNDITIARARMPFKSGLPGTG